jgi:hypothetical protein
MHAQVTNEIFVGFMNSRLWWNAMVNAIRTQEHTAVSSRSLDITLATLAGVIGLLVRLVPVLSSSFPLNDGGLFYQMILDLQANGFVPPLYTSYNSIHIPFAYPPLGLYLAGILSSTLHVSLLDILRIVPPIVSSLCVVAFYYLAQRVLHTGQELTLAATLAFALLPRAFEWHIMGGGITRSFGLLFALLMWRSAFALFTERSARQVLPTAIWGSLTVLSHPEAAFQAALGALILYLILDRSRKGALHAALVIVVCLALTAPWWATVLARFGTGPFLAIMTAVREDTSLSLLARISMIFRFSFTEEPYPPFISVLALIGLFAELGRRRFLLPLWAIIPFLVESRSGPQFVAVPLAMLAGIGLVEVIAPAIRSLPASVPKAARRASAWLLIYLIAFLIQSAYLNALNIVSNYTLQPRERAVFAWVKDNTPADSQFVLITQGNALADPWVEWFPALAQRRSLDTIFGTEWLQGIPFGKSKRQYDSLQLCMNQTLACLQAWKQETGLQFNYILIRKDSGPSTLIESLRESPEYKWTYETTNAVIFASPE